jgi:hypothetical protein
MFSYAATNNVDRLAYLLQLTELELLEWERNAAERRLTAARRSSTLPRALR